MLRSTNASRVRLFAVSLAVAGILFVLYPLLRPFSDESSLQGAQAFASTAWIVAHLLAVVGFILLALGLLGLHLALQQSAVERLAFLALVLSWIGVGLTLPYYGRRGVWPARDRPGSCQAAQLCLAGLGKCSPFWTRLHRDRRGTLAAGSWQHPGGACGVAIWYPVTMEWHSPRPGVCTVPATVSRDPTHQSGSRAAGSSWMHLDRLWHGNSYSLTEIA